MKLIAGLGNPGPEYELSRHNVGFLVLDLLLDACGCTPRRKFSGEVARGVVEGSEVVLLKPLTYMNLSGESVGAAARFYGVVPGDVVAVHDDIDLPSGHIRIKVGGGHGGHNGVRSVIQHLGSPAFTRVKVGIGRPASGDVVGYVLGALSRQERTEFAQTISDAAEAVRVILAQGAPAAMNRFNRKVEREEAEP